MIDALPVWYGGGATDLAGQLPFQAAAAAHRYRLIQSLNGHHIYQVDAAIDAAQP